MSSAYITTKFIPPTNSRGSRIKASCQCGSVTVGYDYSLSIDEAHAVATKALLEKFSLDWGNVWSVGANDSGYVFVPIAKFNTITL